MSNYLKKIISKFFFSKLFQIHPFTGWIINYIIDIPKIKSFKVLNKYIIKINIPSSEAFARFKKCIEDEDEIETLQWLKNNLKKNDVFYDIGSHIGLYILFPILFCNVKNVYGFEPSYANCAQIITNLSINNIKESNIFPIAVGERDHLSSLLLSKIDIGFVSGKVAEKKKNDENSFFDSKILMMKLDTIIKKNKLKEPSIILMDVEGYEIQALTGMDETLKSKKLRNFIIEIHSSSVNSKFTLNVYKTMKKYKFFPIKRVPKDKYGSTFHQIFEKSKI